MDKKSICVNLFSGPGTGKSTFCAGIFSQLKWENIDCEMALEYAKEIVWEGSLEKLKNQIYIFGKQQNRLFKLNGKVDVIITDSPLINSIVYDAKGDKIFTDLILREHHVYDNLNIFLKRKKIYNPNGRYQTFEQAMELDTKIKETLEKNNIEHIEIDAVPENISSIVKIVMDKLKK